MSSRVFVALVAAVVFIAAGMTVHAQIPDCGPPCGGDSTVWPWQYPATPFIGPVYINGCQYNNPPTCCILTAWYRFRHTCFDANNPGTYQIQITSLSWDRDCNPAGFDPVPLIRTAVYGLLTQNPMGFPPDLNNNQDTTTCMPNYTVGAATCWHNVPNTGYAVNCPSSGGMACCKGYYEVCRDTNSQGIVSRKITWLGQSTTFNACDTSGGDTCQPSCGAFNADSIFTRRGDGPPSISLSAPPVHERGGSDTLAVDPVALEPRSVATKERK